ncbi:hypothetical protein CC78DRAFT_621405 [Lojkania enalia]|uniref:Uncharacterized protein n=1 Tax=Lojkania enalia TaxID=147567 RepID=A0A9P4MYX9_9PLEO|nr:hypothetical protein CC78DRAFT_621405 [Didymosphaeria enalia]
MVPWSSGKRPHHALLLTLIGSPSLRFTLTPRLFPRSQPYESDPSLLGYDYGTDYTYVVHDREPNSLLPDDYVREPNHNGFDTLVASDNIFSPSSTGSSRSTFTGSSKLLGANSESLSSAARDSQLSLSRLDNIALGVGIDIELLTMIMTALALWNP